jgi:hypothetical protein
MKKPTPKPTPKPGNPRSYSYIGEMPKKYSEDYLSPAEIAARKRDKAAARRKTAERSSGDRSLGYIKDGKYIAAHNYTSGYRKVIRDEAMPIEAKRDAIAALRNKKK